MSEAIDSVEQARIKRITKLQPELDARYRKVTSLLEWAANGDNAVDMTDIILAINDLQSLMNTIIGTDTEELPCL